MLMSILCPLNLSVRFLWCVQFLSIKHRGVKQAGGRLVPLLQAWISPFGFIFILNGKGGVVVVFGVGLWNTEGAMWRYEEFWEHCMPFTELITIPQTSTSNREYVNILLTRFFFLHLRNNFKFKDVFHLYLNIFIFSLYSIYIVDREESWLVHWIHRHCLFCKTPPKYYLTSLCMILNVGTLRWALVPHRS